jgi:hypothetical protein
MLLEPDLALRKCPRGIFSEGGRIKDEMFSRIILKAGLFRFIT